MHQSDNDSTCSINRRIGSRPFTEIANTAISRRRVLAGSLSGAVVAFWSGKGVKAYANEVRQDSLIGFQPVPVEKTVGDWPIISDDYQFQILVPRGDPIEPGGPKYSVPNNATDQACQIGGGHDGMHYFSTPVGAETSNERGVLALNHEFVSTLTLIGKPAPTNLDEVRMSQHAHGVSVIEIAKMNGSWRTVSSPYARRIHANTPVKFGGPAANSDLLLTPAGNKPQGTVNNCSSGFTPWATYLTCEENVNGYFGVQKNTAWQPSETQVRYGFDAVGFGYFWHRFDPRFDLSNPDYLNESNRFGWVVEIDPFDVNQVPVKRTALGRFKHEGAAVAVGRGGRVVVYMGDDQQFDYIYKFVSDGNWRTMRSEGRSPLDYGKLYVARFNNDYTGDWLELSHDNPKLKGHFADQAEVLIYARLAADKVGATPMDRPEWTTVASDGTVYCTCTNNTQRQKTTRANPTAPNIAGHIIRWRDENHHVGVKFKWDVFMIAAETHGTEASFSSPDGLWADPDGRLFIETDGRQEADRNNQLLVADTNSGEIKRLLSGVKGAEITGITTTPDRKTLFINIQHPGDSVSKPFPRLDDKGVPRDATLVITRKDGGIVGS